MDDFGENLSLTTLYQHSSVFTAEFCPIYQAIRLIQRDKIKTVIFSDSLSVLNAICCPFNNKWIIINKIRDSLVKYNNIIKIHWIPSHINLRLHQKNVILPYLRQQTINTNVSRLRLGHTIFSHQWLLKQLAQPPTCNRCNLHLTIKHILIVCPLYSNHRRKLFGNFSGFDLLREPTSINIIKIHDFIIGTKEII